MPALLRAGFGGTAGLLAFGLLGPSLQSSELAISLWPPLVAATFMFAAIFALRKQRKWAVAAALTGLLFSAFMLPSFLGASKEVEEPDLTVVWLNAMKRRPPVERAYAIAETVGADVVVIAETHPHATVPDGWTVRCTSEPVTIIAREGGPDCVRLEAGRRGSVSLEMTAAGRPIHVIGTHFTNPGEFGGLKARKNEMASLVAGLPEAGPVVSVGDFNTVPWSAGLDPLRKTRLHRVSTGWQTTWGLPVLFAGLPIDHAFVSGGVDASVSVGPLIGSDHRPLIVKTRLASQESQTRER